MKNAQEILAALATGEMDASEFRRETAMLAAPSFWAIEDEARPGTYQVDVYPPAGPVQRLEMSREALEALRSRARSWSVIGGEALEFVHGQNRHLHPFEYET